MPHTGSMPHHLRTAIFAAVFGVMLVGAAWILFRSDGAEDASPPGAVATTAAEDSKEQHAKGSAAPAASRATTKLKSADINTALPPPGAPLVQIYDELKARADAGDVAAAARLFQEAQHCFRARTMMLTMPRSAAALLRQDSSKLNAEQLKEREENLARVEQQIEDARAGNAKCEGLTDAQLQLAPLALQAAKLGDADASRCYVSGIFLYTGGLLDHPEWLTQYRSSALPLAQAAIERGDWAMVAQLSNGYSGELFFAPLGQLLGIDPAQGYRYLKLQRLGAREGSVPRLDDELAAATRELSVEQIAEGDAWAQDVYLRYFGGQPASSDSAGSNFCPN